MYYRKRETDAEFAAHYIATQKKLAADRMKAVSAKKKSKRG